MKDPESDMRIMNAYKNMKPREDVTVDNSSSDLTALKKLDAAYHRMYNPTPKPTYEEYVKGEIDKAGDKFTFMQPDEKIDFYTNCELNYKV